MSSADMLEHSVQKEGTQVWGIALKYQLLLLPAFGPVSLSFLLCSAENSICCL